MYLCLLTVYSVKHEFWTVGLHKRSWWTVTVSIGKLLKNKFSWSKPGGFIAASMLARHVWCGNFTVTLGIPHRFEAEGDTGVNTQVHMRPKAHPVCLKRNVSLLFWVHTNKRRVFTDSKDVLCYFYLYDQKWRRFKSKWAHRKPVLRKRASTPTLQYAHFSRLTSYWAAM